MIQWFKHGEPKSDKSRFKPVLPVMSYTTLLWASLSHLQTSAFPYMYVCICHKLYKIRLDIHMKYLVCMYLYIMFKKC